jgi:uncharacterized protein
MKNLSFSFLILSLIAEILGTVGGFGSSVFFVPIASQYFNFHTALGLTAVFHLSSNVSKIFLFKKGLNKSLLLYLGIPSVIFVIIGGFLTRYLNTKLLELSLGVFLIALSGFFLLFKNIKLKTGIREKVWGGALSGFSAGLLGTGGAIRGIAMAAFNLPKEMFIATSAAIDFAVDLSRTFVYFYNGYIQKDTLFYIPFLLVIGLVGTYLGKQILNKIPQNKFRKLSLVLILIIGLFSVLSVLY